MDEVGLSVGVEGGKGEELMVSEISGARLKLSEGVTRTTLLSDEEDITLAV